MLNRPSTLAMELPCLPAQLINFKSRKAADKSLNLSNYSPVFTCRRQKDSELFSFVVLWHRNFQIRKSCRAMRCSPSTFQSLCRFLSEVYPRCWVDMKCVGRWEALAGCEHTKLGPMRLWELYAGFIVVCSWFDGFCALLCLILARSWGNDI